ncbi:hypothetical protein HJG60_009547 [Phyllostomus discolor]|uniref:Uncharacterized protein n=1 Tax=Phyllostomus discolor TaxID=89673 RepID=A0A834DAT6_9CHIR|nr:hypothetical protein HJG60_009547 [Phyllostomus discolor]
MEQVCFWRPWPLSQVLCHEPVTKSRAVQVPLRKHGKGPTPAFPCGGKPALTFQSKINGDRHLPGQLRSGKLSAQLTGPSSPSQKGPLHVVEDLIEFPVINCHPPCAIWLFSWPHRRVKRTVGGRECWSARSCFQSSKR